MMSVQCKFFIIKYLASSHVAFLCGVKVLMYWWSVSCVAQGVAVSLRDAEPLSAQGWGSRCLRNGGWRCCLRCVAHELPA